MEKISENTIAYFISEQKLTDRMKLSNSLLYVKKEELLLTFEKQIFKLLNLNLSNDIFKTINDKLNKHYLNGIKCVSFLNNTYPRELIRISDFPCILFFKGNIETINNIKRISIVGSRKADYNGKELAFKIANTLASLNIVIVSGLAYGIDAVSHMGAIANKKPFLTIAVLGNGLNSIYPKLNKKLSEEILDNQGLIVSQFPPEMKPLPHNFLNRNRVIAGLSELTLVVQAEEKSGSLVTARYANEFGKIVAAIPGDLKNKLHCGCNKIIKSGAYLIENVEDLIDLLNINTKNTITLKKEDNQILELLAKHGKMSFEELAKNTKQNMDITKELLELEIKNKIIRLPGNYFALSLR